MYVQPAEEEDLTAVLKAVSGSRPGMDPKLIRTLARAPAHADRFLPAYYDLWFGTKLGPKLCELVRLAIANTTGCPLCLAGRMPEAREAGMTEEQAQAVTHAADGPFSDAERAAVSYAYKFGDDHHSIGYDDFAALHEHFTEEQIVELAMLCAHFLGFGRLAKVFELVDPVCQIVSRRNEPAAASA